MAVAQPIGFIGIGNMGAPMARCLARAGFDVLLHDARPEATAPFLSERSSFMVAASPAELGERARVVITMLPTSAIVRAAALGEAGRPGFASSMSAGGIVIDMSSSYPLDTRSLGEALAERGLGLVDAPVSGGVPKAKVGTLAIMAGGEDQHIDAVEAVLKAMGSVHRTGPLGSGHAMKALNNYVSAAGLIAACEALLVGQRFGLDPNVMTRVLNASTGRNNSTENKLAQYIISRAFNSGFALDLMAKDVGMARALAEELGVAVDELEFVSCFLKRASKALGPAADHTAIMRYCESADDDG